MKYLIELKKSGKFWISCVIGTDYMSQGYTREESLDNMKEVISVMEDCDTGDVWIEVLKCQNCNNEFLEKELSDIQIVFDAKEYIVKCKKCDKHWRIYCS